VGTVVHSQSSVRTIGHAAHW